MHPAFDHHLRSRGWRNPQFQHYTGSPLQLSHQTNYQTFISPSSTPLPPQIPFEPSLPISYYDANGPYYHASQYTAVHSPFYENMDRYAPGPQQLQPEYSATQFSAPASQNDGYQLHQKQDTSASTVGIRATPLTNLGRNPVYGANPLYMWQAPPPPHQDMNNHAGPLTEPSDEESRGRKRHSRCRSRRVQSEERAGGETNHQLGPSTPKRDFLRATPRRRQSEPPSEGILQSAKQISRDILTCPWKPGRDDKADSEKNQDEDQNRMGSSRGLRTQEHRQASAPTTPPARSPQRPEISTKYKTRRPMHSRRLSKAACPRTPRRGHRAESRNHSTQKVSPVQVGHTEDTTGGRPHSRADLSDLDDNMEISKMNGLLDIWDSAGNPHWEKETFALCDLEHCHRCGKYYVLMRTIPHNCRR